MVSTLDDIAKEEFSNLDKTRFDEIKRLARVNPKIYIISKSTDVIKKISETVNDLNYSIAGVTDNGRNSILDIEILRPDLIFISVDLEGDWDGVETGKHLSKFNIPIIYIFNNETDLESDEFLLSNYGFIFENYDNNQIKFAIGVVIEKHLRNINTIEEKEERLHEKNSELGVEKFYSVLVLTISFLIIITGLYTRNLTFIQWIIFIPAVSRLILAFYSLKKQKEPVEYDVPPFVSIFIPAHNEEFTIGNTVKSISSMDYTLDGEPNFEVIVVNDGSTDNTGEILSELKKDFSNLRIITRKPPKSGKGKGFVLNDALILAKGDIIGVFDADTRVDKDYLTKIIPYLNEESVQAVQSRVRMYNKDFNFLTRMQEVEFAGFGNVLRAKDNIGYNGFLGGNGQFTKKDAVMKSGQWDGFAVTEDLNLSVKIALKKGDIRYCPDVAIYQEAVTRWGDFLRQRTRWAIGNFETLFIFFSRIVRSDLSFVEKFGILSHVSYYGFNLFIFIGFIIFLVNTIAYFVWNIPTVINMDAPVIIGITSAVAFVPGTTISILRDKPTAVMFIKDVISYWLYCFYLIPLFFKVMYDMITRKERSWDKTVHRGDNN